MRFGHISDTHLGRTEAGSPQREQDFYAVFSQAIDRFIAEGVDFVVHSGDLFDRPRPTTKTLIEVVRALRRLAKAGIPFYIVPGSHDIGIEGTMLALLETIGLLTNLAAERYYSVEGEQILLRGESRGDVWLCGIAGRRARIREIYERLRPVGFGEAKKKKRIFVFHHIVSDISERFADIPTSLLPKGFDYYAGGHWHSWAELEHDGGKLIYPGSTEFNDLTEMQRDSGKFFAIVDLETGHIEQIKTGTRPILTKEINCQGADAQAITPHAIEAIPDATDKATKAPILILKLKGRLRGGTKSEIDRAAITRTAESRGFLYSKIYLGELENPEAPVISARAKTPAQIEREYLRNQHYTETQIELAQALIKLLGTKLAGPHETELAQAKAIKLINKLSEEMANKLSEGTGRLSKEGTGLENKENQTEQRTLA